MEVDDIVALEEVLVHVLQCIVYLYNSIAHTFIEHQYPFLK